MADTTLKQPSDEVDDAYGRFFNLLYLKLFRASSIWWRYFTNSENESLHSHFERDPASFIDDLMGGRINTFHRVMMDKFEAALMVWAIETMGEQFEKYVEDGLEDFLTRAMLSPTKRKFLTSIRKSPLVFPVTLGKTPGFPYERFEEIRAGYEEALRRIQKLKKRRWHPPSALRLALEESLPGFPVGNSWNDKPSDIALLYVVWKYKLPLGIESLRKHLSLKRIPQELWDIELKRMRKRRR